MEGWTTVKKRWLIVFLGIVVIGSAGEAWAAPQWPQTLWGTVKKDCANVPDGTVISAWIGGIQYVSKETFTSGGDSVYSIDVPADDPDTTATEGGVDGNTVSFKVGSDIASQTAVFSSGNPTNLPLTVSPIYYVSWNGSCGGKTPCFETIQNAIDSAVCPTIIEITQDTYDENVILDDPKELTLRGGWDSAFTSNLSKTVIDGFLRIDDGMLVVENIVLQ